MASEVSSPSDTGSYSDRGFAHPAFDVQLRDVHGRTAERARLQHALALALHSAPHPGLSQLCSVQYSGSRAVALFERGDGTLEQRITSSARGSCLLPLPFLWSVRLALQATAIVDYHTASSRIGGSSLVPRAIMTVAGETRLNAALLVPGSASETAAPSAASIAATLATCLAGGGPETLARSRAILPAAVLSFIDDAPARASRGSSWVVEQDLLLALARVALGPCFAATTLTQRSPAEIVRQQLSLLPALAKLEDACAVDAYFVRQRSRWHGQVPEFRAAVELWHRQRRLAPTPAGECTAVAAALDQRELETRFRVAQARLEFRRRDARVALAFAIDAARMAPEEPDCWLALSEINGLAHAGARALSLSEAICASRGEPTVCKLARKQLGLASDSALAAYFRKHGDHVLAAWLDAGNSDSRARLDN